MFVEVFECDVDLQVMVVVFFGLQVDGQGFYGYEYWFFGFGWCGGVGCGVIVVFEEELGGIVVYVDEQEYDQDDQQQFGGVVFCWGGGGSGGSGFGYGDYLGIKGGWVFLVCVV